MNGRFSSKKGILVVLLILNLVFSSVVLANEIIERVSESRLQDQYTLYIGTNDKDTNLQEISLNECKMRVENVCLQHVSGFTITEADGAWSDDAGNISKEKSLVCRINGAAAAEINSIVDQLLLELNQSSILVEHQKLNSTYRGQ